MTSEVIQYLNPGANQNYIDGTLGAGGHAKAILEKTGPKGKLIGIDWDKEALGEAREFLTNYGTRFIPVHDSYTNLKQILNKYVEENLQINGIVLDLGLSSDQLARRGRGFSFQMVEPLDMRFSPDLNGLTAEHILNNYSEKDLIKILREYGEEPRARKIAQAIVGRRKEKPFVTTKDLTELIESVVLKGKSKIHPATKTFQALRIEVNDELANVKSVLRQAEQVIIQGGRIAIISFHSLEDRIVKQYFKQQSKDCICPKEIPECRCDHRASLKRVTKKAITASEEEISENPRARSAKLRVAEII